MRRSLLLFVALLILALPVAAQDDLPLFEEDTCPFPDLPDVTCGYLIVPEDRDDLESPEIELAVAIIAAENGNPLPDPVIYLEGGPGGSALFAVEDFLTHPLRGNRDLILIDQRGTGFSLPSLNCFELEEEDAFGDDPTTACYERLSSEGINLSAYNSAASAADINDLRIALGYDEVNLWGISYGTRLALTVMRDYPENIRSVVIDSVFPPEVDGMETGIGDSLRAFNLLFESCAADAACSAAFPNLEANFYEVVVSFNENPPVFEYDDGMETFEREIIGDEVADALFQTMYNSAAIPMLPFGINMLANAQDDFDYQDGIDILQGFWTPESWAAGFTEGGESVFESEVVMNYIEEVGDISDSEGMYQSVECVEEFAFNDLDTAYATLDAAPEELQAWLAGSIDTSVLDCEIWVVEAAPSIEAERVVSDIPTLLISGDFDPITPPANADSAAEGLSDSTHIVFPTGAHGETGSAGCGADIARAFIDDPGADLDTSCIPQAVEWFTG